jgi:hypothetical protein
MSGHGGQKHGGDAHGAGQGSTSSAAFDKGTTEAQTLSQEIALCVDHARQCQADLGFNPHRSFLVRKEWDGGRVGVGAPTITEVEILPPPYLEDWKVAGELRATGLDEEGSFMLTGISRAAFAEPDLFSPEDVDGDDTRFYYKITGARTTDGIRPRYFVPMSPPLLDTGSMISKPKAARSNSWTVRLRRILDQ